MKLRLRHLIGSWCAYWAGLVTVKLGDLIAASVLVARMPDNSGATITAGFNDAMLNASVTDGVSMIYESSVHWLVATSWVALPPLVLWAIWLLLASRSRPSLSPPSAPKLAEPAPDHFRAGQRTQVPHHLHSHDE